ncbi:MAG: hypothetical protein K2P95_05600 [Hyphomonadaceae bacterium]|nr:hypothetical protein [Hyphomonadaceae bacterium]
MSDVTNELLFEVLITIPTKLDTLEQKIDDLGVRLLAVEQHMSALQISEYRQNSELDRLRSRIERTEKRLDLVD